MESRMLKPTFRYLLLLLDRFPHLVGDSPFVPETCCSCGFDLSAVNGNRSMKAIVASAYSPSMLTMRIGHFFFTDALKCLSDTSIPLQSGLGQDGACTVQIFGVICSTDRFFTTGVRKVDLVHRV